MPNQLMATEVGGIINENTVWDLAGSPYIITNEVQIADNVTLTIKPGVVVNEGNIRVWGTLSAIGTNDLKINFNNVHIGPGKIPGHMSIL